MSSAAISYTVTHWAFPPVGYEGMLVLAGLMIWADVYGRPIILNARSHSPIVADPSKPTTRVWGRSGVSTPLSHWPLTAFGTLNRPRLPAGAQAGSTLALILAAAVAAQPAPAPSPPPAAQSDATSMRARQRTGPRRRPRRCSSLPACSVSPAVHGRIEKMLNLTPTAARSHDDLVCSSCGSDSR
jgi:hypothetical protein